MAILTGEDVPGRQRVPDECGIGAYKLVRTLPGVWPRRPPESWRVDDDRSVRINKSIVRTVGELIAEIATTRA